MLSGGNSWMQRGSEKEVPFRGRIARVEIDLFRWIGQWWLTAFRTGSARLLPIEIVETWPGNAHRRSTRSNLGLTYSYIGI
jgi:hypothetical protein